VGASKGLAMLLSLHISGSQPELPLEAKAFTASPIQAFTALVLDDHICSGLYVNRGCS